MFVLELLLRFVFSFVFVKDGDNDVKYTVHSPSSI